MTDYEINKIDDLSRTVRSINRTKSKPANIIDLVLVGAFIYIAIKMFSPYLSEASEILKYLK